MDPVLVIGAGIGGLSVALRLRRLGLPVQVLEASDRPGGTIRSSTEQGFQFEHGPTLLFDREPATRELVESVGLPNRLLHAGPEAWVRYLYVRRRLKLIPPATKILRSDLLSLKARVRIFAEVATPRPRSDDESVLEFGQRHVGEEATRTLLDPLVGAMFGGDIARLSARSCFPSIHALEQQHRSLVVGLVEEYRALKRTGESRPVLGNLISFLGGIEELPQAMAAVLGGSLRLGARAVRVTPGARGVEVELAGGERLHGSAAVLALPAYAAAALFRETVPQAAALMAQVPYAPIALVHLGLARQAVGADLSSLGFFAPSGEGLDVIGCLYSSSLYPGRAPAGHVLLTAVLGGATRPHIATRTGAELIQTAVEQLGPILDFREAPRFARAVLTPRALPQYEVGTSRRNEALRETLRRAGPLFLAGNAYEGIGIADCIRRAGAIAEAVRSRVLPPETSVRPQSRPA